MKKLWIALLILSACQTESVDLVERPTELWVRRSVLDQHPRMVTLALKEDRYVAYDTEQCSIYKIWRGGVHWQGAVFTNIKTIQPTSWGKSYWERDEEVPVWMVAAQDGNAIRRKEVKPRYRGYRIESGRLTFEYEVLLSGGSRITIFEQPEWSGDHGFSQFFSVEGLPDGVVIHYGDYVLDSNDDFEFVRNFDPIEQPERPVANLSANGSRYWLDRSGCNTCHELEEHTVGPSYRAIAGRYDRDPSTIEQLVQKVKVGGSGVWGDTPMNPHPHISDADIIRMLQYILSLKPSEKTGRTKKRTIPKPLPEAKRTAGFGAPVEGLHPSLIRHDIRPDHFRPRVGGLDFLPDGRLLVSTWDSIGAVYALSGVLSGDSSRVTVQRIAEGLAEPLGIKVVEDEVYVLQKHELTQLIDHDSDGITDEYRNVCNSFGVSADFHEYSYGLAYKEGYFYASLGLAMRMMAHERQHPDRGTVIRISKNGEFTKLAVGLRQPNGIGFNAEGELFVTENQGRWVPANKVIKVEEGAFYGCRKESGTAFDNREETPPTVWLPQDEIGNSPSQPVPMLWGPYEGQMLHGEVTHGGIKRVFIEQVNGKKQGCVFRFSQGMEAGVNRLVWGPDTALYAGGVGMTGNWSWRGHQYGLQRFTYSGVIPFEMLAVRARPEGLEIEFTKEVSEEIAGNINNYLLQQWRYEATKNYGGPKLDLETLSINRIEVSPDGRKARLYVVGMKKKHVLYVRLSQEMKSLDGHALWSGECWYTMNNIPANERGQL